MFAKIETARGDAPFALCVRQLMALIQYAWTLSCQSINMADRMFPSDETIETLSFIQGVWSCSTHRTDIRCVHVIVHAIWIQVYHVGLRFVH